MGNSLTADAATTPLPEVESLRQPSQPLPSDVKWNLKAWSFRSNESESGEPVLLAPQMATVDPCRSYLVLLTKRRGTPAPASAGVASSAAQLLNDTCSPRGLSQPFSLNYDWFNKRARDGKGPSTQSTLYLFNGINASAYTKAIAFRRGLELERLLAERWWLGDALLSTGRPVPTNSLLFDCVQQVSPQLSTPRETVPVHLLSSISGEVPMHPPRPSSRKRRHLHEDPAADLVRQHSSPEEDVPDEKLEEQRTREKLLAWSPLVSDVTPFLCVSGQEPAESLERLLQARVTHVLNTVEMLVDSGFPEHFSYLPMRMADSLNEDISAFFPHAIAHIERVRKSAGKLLIHCVQGVSRSCTLILSYLLWLEVRPYAETYEFLRTKRGIARPNFGFQTRLEHWYRHLKTPPPVQIYRLKMFSPESPGPLIFLLERCGYKGAPAALDTRTAYLVLDLRATPDAFIWTGSECIDALRAAARKLAPEVMLYGVRTSPSAPQPVVWPERLLQPSGVPCVADGGESGGQSAVLREGGAVGRAGRQQAFDSDYADTAAMASHYASFCRDQEVQAASEKEREQARACDLIALRSALVSGLCGSMSMSLAQQDATPRLRSERLEANGLYVRKGSEGSFSFEPHPGYGRFGFDDDDFEVFQESHSADVCIFVKLRSDRRLIDVWFGQKALPQQERGDPTAAAQSTLEAFRRWLKSSEGPKWGLDVQWGRVDCFCSVDQSVEDDDIRFLARWIRD